MDHVRYAFASLFYLFSHCSLSCEFSTQMCNPTVSTFTADILELT